MFFNYVLATASTPTTLQEILTNVGSIITQVLGWVGDAAETIVSTPLLFITMGFLMLGGAIGILSRLLRKN